MNSFVVVFAAVIAVVASANVAGRSGWNQPAGVPNIELALGAGAAANAEGSALANQQVIELASGNAAVPASISSLNGVSAVVEQQEVIDQLAVANIPSGSTATLNDVLVLNDASGNDLLQAAVSGANLAVVENSGATDASGHGQLAAEANSVNLVNGAGQGWKSS